MRGGFRNDYHRFRFLEGGRGTRIHGPAARECRATVRNGVRAGQKCRQLAVKYSNFCRWHGGGLNPRAREHLRQKRLEMSPATTWYWAEKHGRRLRDRERKALIRSAGSDEARAGEWRPQPGEIYAILRPWLPGGNLNAVGAGVLEAMIDAVYLWRNRKLSHTQFSERLNLLTELLSVDRR